MTPPTELDEAKVLFIAEIANDVSATGKAAHFSGNETLPKPRFLAIAQYPGDSGFYLFYCDDAWNVMTDTLHMTIAEAKEQAEFEFYGISNHWKRPLPT